MSYFIDDALSDAEILISKFENSLDREDQIAWRSGVSDLARKKLLDILSNELYHLHLSYAYKDL